MIIHLILKIRAIYLHEWNELVAFASVINVSTREVYKTYEFEAFLSGLDDRARTKFDHAIEIVMTVKVIPAKFVKKLAGCDFYEMRVSVGFNEYRTIGICSKSEQHIK